MHNNYCHPSAIGICVFSVVFIYCTTSGQNYFTLTSHFTSLFTFTRPVSEHAFIHACLVHVQCVWHSWTYLRGLQDHTLLAPIVRALFDLLMYYESDPMPRTLDIEHEPSITGEQLTIGGVKG
jgi:hypothetical protein